MLGTDPAAVEMKSHAMLRYAIVPAAWGQDEIGWENFRFGQIATKWWVVQASHYQDISSRHTVKRWASGLVTCLLAICDGVMKLRNSVVHARDEKGRGRRGGHL